MDFSLIVSIRIFWADHLSGSKAKGYKSKLYALGIPVIYFSSDELKKKRVKFKKDPVETDYGYEAIFDDSDGNYIQLI